MGFRLCFQSDEMKAMASTKEPCEVCKERPQTWEAIPKEEGPALKVCGHCAMYSMKTKWGYENREELLHVGRFCQGHALKHRRDVPDLDERGRLEPLEAERFLMGVAYSTLILKKISRFGKNPELDNTSS